MEIPELHLERHTAHKDWLLTHHHQHKGLKAIDHNFKPKLKTIIIIIVAFLFYASSNGQANTVRNINTSELWGDMTITKSINVNWDIGGDFGVRTALSDTKFWLFYLRPNLSYKPSDNYKFTLGLATFNTLNDQLFDTNEIRVYQDAIVHWPELGIFNFSHRLRLEERFLSFSESSIDNDFRLRGRYLLGVRTDNFSIGGEPNWSVFGSLEPFFRLNGKDKFRVNNFRWDTALSYQATEQLRIELHYILQSSEFFFNNDQSLENIFRIRVYQQL